MLQFWMSLFAVQNCPVTFIGHRVGTRVTVPIIVATCYPTLPTLTVPGWVTPLHRHTIPDKQRSIFKLTPHTAMRHSISKDHKSLRVREDADTNTGKVSWSGYMHLSSNGSITDIFQGNQRQIDVLRIHTARIPCFPNISNSLESGKTQTQVKCRHGQDVCRRMSSSMNQY
jgi:hypothetical protein